MVKPEEVPLTKKDIEDAYDALLDSSGAKLFTTYEKWLSLSDPALSIPPRWTIPYSSAKTYAPVPGAMVHPRIAVCYQTRIKPEVISGILLNRLADLPINSYLACRANPKGQTDDMVFIMAMALGIPTTAFATANIPGVRTITAFDRDKQLAVHAHCGIIYLHEEDEGAAIAPLSSGGTLNVMHQLKMLDKAVELWFVNDAGDAVKVGSSDDLSSVLGPMK